MNDEQELRERLNSARGYSDHRNSGDHPAVSAPMPTQRTDVDFAQWQVLPNGKYRPGARTAPILPAGAYRAEQDDFGPFLAKIDIASDDLIELPESSHLRVLSGIRKFWDSKSRYQKHGLLYKRGVLLWGPPGGGKTVTSQLLMQEIIQKHDGVVIFTEHPELTVAALRFLRRIEPQRPLIVLLEDVDEIVSRHGEHSILAMLDGEHQTDNVVYVATTNYPERLGPRIVNRPSRFDERIKIGMPSAAARMAYLRKACGDAQNIPLDKWCDDTAGLSIAHLRELVVAVICLDQEYEDVVGRLRAMEIMPKPEEGFRRNPIGIADASKSASLSSIRTSERTCLNH